MRFLIWSNEHQAWWRANGRGYTGHIEEAGRHTREQAERQVSESTLDGVLTVRREDPVTGVEYSQLSEVMVLAPEDIPGRTSVPCPAGSSCYMLDVDQDDRAVGS